MVRRATPDQQRRFLEEAQVMAQLDHPNIVPVFEVGLSNGKPYYTMRVVHGRSLAAVLEALHRGDEETRRTYSLARRMQVFVQIGQAVSYAHAKGVIHRDLKPCNVMLGRHGEVQVMDWGLRRPRHGGNVRDWTATAEIEGEGDERRVSRVDRGGCWGYTARDCRVTARAQLAPDIVYDFLGFRLARSLP